MSMRHAFLLLAAVIAVNVEDCMGIVCFYCTIQPPNILSNKTAQLCSKFDHSNNFHIDCPYSTLCIKRTYQHSLQGGKKVKVSERGCAPQKKNVQVLKNGSWHSESTIESDVYRVGCEEDEGLGVRSPTEYCYCATNLCNSADTTHVDTMAVIVIFNILKYIESLRYHR